MIAHRKAEELVDKFEALADRAKTEQTAAAAAHNLTRHAELVERETNYRHSAELARNLLGVRD